MIKKFQYGGFSNYYNLDSRNTRKAVSEGTKKFANAGLNVLGIVGDLFSSLFTGTPTTTINPKTVSPEMALQLKQSILKGMTWLSPLNYGAALATGHGFNAKKGEKQVTKWDPRLLLIGRLGELYVGPKAIRGASKGVKKGIVANEFRRTINEGLKTSDRMYTQDKGSYELYNSTGDIIGDILTMPSITKKGKGISMVEKKNRKYHGVSEDLYNIALEDAKLLGYMGLESGWELFQPLLTRHVTSKFPHFEFKPTYSLLEHDPIRMLTGVSKKKLPFPIRNLTEHSKRIYPKETLQYDETSQSFMPIELNIPKELHPWELSNSLYSRFLLPDGTIRLQLNSHTKDKPRQFVLDPQGDNKYYVHMKVWDDVDKKVPATMSSTEKNTLFEALYNELPDGAEILFPKSGPGYYGTRGTVAGLLHLSRDSRFTPGTKGTLLYLDKDGKTVRTYNGTSFIKNSNKYNREPVLMGDEWGVWEVEYPDYVKGRIAKIKKQVEDSNGKVKGHDYEAMPGSIIDLYVLKLGFHPFYVLNPGSNLRALLAETTRRLNNIAGQDVVRNRLMNLDGRAPYYLGYFDEPGTAGMHSVKSGINLIEPNPKTKMHLDMMHEGISHGTDNYMPQNVINNYQSFVDKVMSHPDINPEKTSYKYKGWWTEPILSDTDKWFELRATLGEIRKAMYDRIAKLNGTKVNESTIEALRPEFERLVDAISLDLAAETLRKTNPYGRVYGTLGPTVNPSFLSEFKELLKYAPAVGTPLIFRYNEKE